MREGLISFIFLMNFFNPSSAQITFQKTYGDSTVNDNGQSILQTDDGGYIIAATRFTSGNYIESLFLIRTDGAGDTLWTKLINEPTINYSASQIIKTFDGGFAITGIKGGGVTSVPYLVKIDSLGNILWNKSYLWFADEHISSLIQTPDSGFLLAGYLYNGNNLVYFIRINAIGDTLWTKSYEENFYNASVYSVRLTLDGGFIAAGSVQNTNTQDVDAFLFKTDSSGNVLWARGYGDTDYDYAQMAEATSDGGFIIAGVTYSFGAGLADFFLIKTDSTGVYQWSKTYGGVSDDRSESVIQTDDGGYLFTGESASFSTGNFDVYIIRTISNGDTLWTKTLNGLSNNEGYSLIPTADNGFAITGTYYSQQGNNDVLFIKADSTGWIGCSESSAMTTVTNPTTQVVNHHFNYLASSPSVVMHLLDETSGASVEILCEHVGISGDSENSNSIFIYPNPVSSQCKIHLPIAIGTQFRIRQIEILDIFGNNYFIFQFTSVRDLQDVEIDVSGLAPGIYFVTVQTGTNSSTLKLIKL